VEAVPIQGLKIPHSGLRACHRGSFTLLRVEVNARSLTG
jgi:hypothetical protein